MAAVEVTAYQRLQPLLRDNDGDASSGSLVEQAQELLERHAAVLEDVSNKWCNIAVSVLLQWTGRVLEDDTPTAGSPNQLVRLAEAKRQNYLCQLDELRQRVGSGATNQVVDRLPVAFLTAATAASNDAKEETAVAALKSACILCDGETVFRNSSELFAKKIPSSTSCYAAIQKACELPTVRVINLQRRTDRWNAFLSVCMREKLLVVKGVMNLSSLAKNCFGEYAFDGSGRLAEAHKQEVGSRCEWWRKNAEAARDRRMEAKRFETIRQRCTQRRWLGLHQSQRESLRAFPHYGMAWHH